MFSKKYNHKDFRNEFGTDDQCLEFLFQKKYGDVKTCPKCGKPFNYSKVKGRRQYQCNHCNHTIAPTANTIFHKSPTSLVDWFFAIFLFSCSKNGVSAMELQRQLGVTYKTAWRIANQVRKLFDETGSDQLKGTVEMDEAYLGGKEENKHKSKRYGHKGTQGKTAVMGAVERGGDVKARVVDDTTVKTVMPFVRGQVEIGTQLVTDDYNTYSDIRFAGYKHESINHSQKEYLRDIWHTNTIEGFWSQLKRSIDGTYHMVSPKHLQHYVNEFSWRYNRREVKGSLFGLMLGEV